VIPRRRAIALCFIIAAVVQTSGPISARQKVDQPSSETEQACLALAELPNLTIIYVRLKPASPSTPTYCYVKGIISPAIQYHVQLPLPENWNGRFLMWGDGGTDGVLDFADLRLAQGYAVANSNSGHDSGSEPGYSFAYDNRQAEIDFGYRAEHLTVNAAQTIIKAYYRKAARKSYFEGCSLGGREGLMEAQRYPYDFDGIVAGSPAIFNQALFATRIQIYQRLFQNHFAGNLAFDTKGNGSFDSLNKLNILKEAVLAKCDANDGIVDGVIEDPLSCRFRPDDDLKSKMCPGDVNADNCFTKLQLQNIKDIYAGSHDSKGRFISKGRAFGSEFGWPRHLIPYAGNSLVPSGLGLAADRLNYFFYETDPGVPTRTPTDPSLIPDRRKQPPEYSWSEFNIDDVTSGLGDYVSSILDAKDPNLTSSLLNYNGKIILYHGWGDALVPPETTLDYYKDVVTATFAGNLAAASEHIRLFMVPGMDHCKGGPGPDTWDKLAPLVEWVEKGMAPDYLVATHSTQGKVDNERRICPYPQRAVYTGPAGTQNDRASWIQSNFTCRQP
jgi:feruloyl esterase